MGGKAKRLWKKAIALTPFENEAKHVRLTKWEKYEVRVYCTAIVPRGPLPCQVIRGILFDSVPALYQILK